ncbi:hypothetical protein EAI30_10195 [Romboutsia ilealis]|uniref:Phage tail protein n=1 Tax=Romboutsia faecis TaxID=2764597 RepID=A0ABR7JN87_9FIRM|nr:hypothetical protein [Romboutsia faecis]MBC5996377.1 hypothetical protein [Romboutsia faecis]MRN24987.1 hypothetical protein [Romboutsia ilealis]
MSERITLGSGNLYYKEFTGEIPENETIETEQNRLGYISGGATLEYKPTYYEAKDDLGVVVKTILTEEEVILKSGIMTFNGKTLEVLCETGRVTEDSSKHIRTVKIGGPGNANGKSYIIHFVHKDPVDGDIRITIVGKNQAGFSLAFAKDKETVIDAEFKALPQDSEGTLIKYQEFDSTITE